MSVVIFGGNDNHCLTAAAELAEDQEVNFADVMPKYGIILLMQETSEDELNDLSSELPTDTHLVTYRFPDGATGVDAVRSYSKVDIFDAYHDSGLQILDIKSGFGSIKPKLFNDRAEVKK